MRTRGVHLRTAIRESSAADKSGKIYREHLKITEHFIRQIIALRSTPDQPKTKPLRNASPSDLMSQASNPYFRRPYPSSMFTPTAHRAPLLYYEYPPQAFCTPEREAIKHHRLTIIISVQLLYILAKRTKLTLPNLAESEPTPHHPDSPRAREIINVSLIAEGRFAPDSPHDSP